MECHAARWSWNLTFLSLLFRSSARMELSSERLWLRRRRLSCISSLLQLSGLFLLHFVHKAFQSSKVMQSSKTKNTRRQVSKYRPVAILTIDFHHFLHHFVYVLTSVMIAHQKLSHNLQSLVERPEKEPRKETGCNSNFEINE